MNWGTCSNGSNNIHFDFPPIMNDGRNYSSWQPNARINNDIIKKYNIKSNSDYRAFLTKNADNIIKQNQLTACGGCCNCLNIQQSTKTSNTPYLYQSCSDSTQPYGYENSDLKETYLSREQLNRNSQLPSLTQEDYLKMNDRNKFA
tara:strand:+ start:18188 stop:18625 length:438 start_codon:yes stop_codon:yes gene_type:complete